MTAKHLGKPQEDYLLPANRLLAIFMVSIWALFLEMLLIRWIGTEIRIFAYLQNTVLVVCFLGLGLGCFTSRKPIVLRHSLLPLLFITLLMAHPMTRATLGRISEFLSVLHDTSEIMWTANKPADLPQVIIGLGIGLSLTYLIMALIIDMFVPIGRLLGRLMDEHPNTIQAYSTNIAGSLAGTWLFVLASFFFMPPAVWAAVTAVLAAFFLGRSGSAWRLNLAMLAAIVVFSWFSGQQPGSMDVVWSPYQKLVLYRTSIPSINDHVISMNVNNVGYQAMLNDSDALTSANPDRYDPAMRGMSQYDIPFLLHPAPKTALLVGAGSGNDAAGALRRGVEQVTAVEIDPAIISLGTLHHPERPYSSPRVKLVNDDARSFFATCEDKFDVIVFGLLDSHTTTAMTNMRLDNYVYTRQSIAKAKGLLADGGIMVLSFEVRKPYIADRLAGALREAFGEEPLCFRVPYSAYGFGGVMFVAGDLETARAMIFGNEGLSALIDSWKKQSPVEPSYSAVVADDDWPYIYLEKPGIPSLYFLLAGLMVALVARSRKHTEGERLLAGLGREHWHFFFLGAAFLLLEVQNISKASVVLGNTWEVNAVIVSGVLIMILLSNLIAYRFPRMPLWPVYTALCCSCVALYFVDLASFAFLPYAVKSMIVGGLTTLPMLFGGIIFIRSFTIVTGKDKALGANLVGAVFGALLQSVTFLTGIKALLLMVAGLYLLAMYTKPATAGNRVSLATRPSGL